MLTETVEPLILLWVGLRIIMRSFRGYKASTLPTWVGNRGLAAYYSASLSQTVEELGRAGTDAFSKSAHEDTVSGKICLKTRDWRHSRGVTTFSAGGSGGSSSKRKDPSFLLGAGWEAGGEDVTVAVWWDFENCNVPLGIEVYKVGVNIVSGLRMCGFKGPVSISAYGDTLQLSRSTQEALASTGIQLHHIPSGGKDSSDRALLVDLILWTFEHPPPAHLFLISGDRDFSNALHRLRMMNYNILLACPAGSIVSPALLGAASQVWQWNSLVRGEGLLFVNLSSESKPPDGPSGGGIAALKTTQKPYSPSSLHPGSRGPDGGGPLVDVGGKPNPPPPSPSSTIRSKVRTKAAAAKAKHNERQGSNAAADSTRSTKVTIEQKAPKALKPAKVNPDYPPKVPQIPAVGIKEQANLPKEFEITSSLTEMPPETRSADRQTPLPQSVEDPTLQPKESERSMKKGVQLSEMSAFASAQMGKSDQRDSHAVGEKAPSPRLPSFMSKLISMFRRSRKDQGVDTNSSFLPQGGSLTVDKTKVRSSDLDLKKMACSTASRADSIESGGVVADGILHKPLVNDSKHRFSVSDGGFKEKSDAVCDEGASREKLRGQQSTVFVDQAQRRGSEFSWKTWLFGPAQEKSASSVTGGPIADSSKSPAVYDMTDLDKTTWKELLSWPGKLTQTSTGSKSELSANTSHHGVIGREDEARMRDNTTSSPTEGHKLKEEKASSGSSLEDLTDYLRTPEGTAILSEARDLVEVVNTLKTTGPNKFRGLQSSQIADLIYELETTKEGSNHRYLTAPVTYSVRANNEGLADQLRTRSARQSTEIVGQQVIHSIGESSLPEEQGESVKPQFQDKESPNGSMHDELLSNHFVDIQSLSNNGILILKQEDQIRNLEDDSVPLRVSNSIEDSSLSAKMFPITPLSKTEVSGPSFLEFQDWFVETVKEAYKSSERTRRIGFDLSLVKPDFEREFGIRLDPRVYGFIKLQDLVASVSAVRVTRPRNSMCVVCLLKEGAILEEDQRGEITVSTLKASRWPQMYHDCKSLVRELMLENPEGLPGTKLKPMFMSRFQYPLDHKHAGYQKMSDLLKLMPDVVSVSGKYLIPSKELFLSLKNEAKGEEIKVYREVIVEEDNVSSDTYSQSKQDVKLAKVGFESTEGWGEIDTEGNGNSSPSAYVIEATPEEVPGLQDENAYRSGIIEKVPYRENVAAQYLVPAETNSGGETDNLQRPIFPTDVQGPSVDEFGQELLNIEPRENHRVRENTSFESCLLSGEPLLNAIKVKCETDKDSRDGQEPPISLYESREGHQAYHSDDDKDTCKKEEELFVEKNQDGSEHIEEGLELIPGTAILGDSNADVIDEQIKVASCNVRGVEPEIVGSFGALGNVDQETAAESPPSSLYDTSADIITVGLETEVDFTQTQESDVSQTMERSEGRDETSNTRNFSSGLELENETSGEKHTSNNESIIDFDVSTGHNTLDTVLKAAPSTDKNSPKETINLENNATISPGSLREDRKKGFEGLMGDGPLDKELKTSSSIEECQTSAGVSNHDEERPPKVGEATDEGHTEGYSSGSVSSDRQSLKSIWKRLFS